MDEAPLMHDPILDLPPEQKAVARMFESLMRRHFWAAGDMWSPIFAECFPPEVANHLEDVRRQTVGPRRR